MGNSSYGPRLTTELAKALIAGKHAFVSGYPEVIEVCRSPEPLPPRLLRLDPKAETFCKERYKLLDSIDPHPLTVGGFESRIGHYTHCNRRNDWRAVAKDIVNLHLGARSPDVFSEVFKDTQWMRRKNVAITFKDEVGSFYWPCILGNFFSGIIPNVAAALANKGGLHITARKEGKMVVLDFKCAQKPRLSSKHGALSLIQDSRPQRKKTLALVKEIVEYFGGSFKMSKEKSKFCVSISLPHEIRVDGPYGGYLTEEQCSKW